MASPPWAKKIQAKLDDDGEWTAFCWPCVASGRDTSRCVSITPTSDRMFAWIRGHISWHREQRA